MPKFRLYFVRKLSGKIHDEVLDKLLNAPINLFFDITPLGMLLNRLRTDLAVFNPPMLEAHFLVIWTCSQTCILIFYIGKLNSLPIIALTAVLWLNCTSKIIPFMKVKDKLNKLGSALNGPIDSYFYESMNGVSVIKAFGQNETIIKKQEKLLD